MGLRSGDDEMQDLLGLIRSAGPLVVAQKIWERTWWTRVFLGLRCDLNALPPLRPAKFEIIMTPCNSHSFSGFRDELEHVKGPEYLDVYRRKEMCEAGVCSLYVAAGPARSPAYAQWLITRENQHLLHQYQPGRYVELKPGEVLLEGAYTFLRFRRTGVMANGMGQLLRIARAHGAHTAFTSVAADNVPSLRGCASVGFTLDHVRSSVRRLGVRSSIVSPPDDHAKQMWQAATAPHSRA